MTSLEQVFNDIKNLDEDKKIKRVPDKKTQVFGNDFINLYFVRSGYEAPAEPDKGDEEHTRYYYVIIENGDNPIPPTLMTPAEIEEALGIKIASYY